MIDIKYFTKASCLKLLVALYTEDLDPISLLYKVSLMDFKNELLSNNIRNINAFGFYLRNYRKVLNELYDSFLIRINDKNICLTFDGKGLIKRLRELSFIQSYMKTAKEIECDSSSTYRQLYLDELKEYTAVFVKKERV